MHRLIVAGVVRCIGWYQNLRQAWLPACCRFYPSCSEYTKQAVLTYGLTRGCLKAAGRIMRCHPFSGQSGYDPLV